MCATCGVSVELVISAAGFSASNPRALSRIWIDVAGSFSLKVQSFAGQALAREEPFWKRMNS